MFRSGRCNLANFRAFSKILLNYFFDEYQILFFLTLLVHRDPIVCYASTTRFIGPLGTLYHKAIHCFPYLYFCTTEIVCKKILVIKKFSWSYNGLWKSSNLYKPLCPLSVRIQTFDIFNIGSVSFL